MEHFLIFGGSERRFAGPHFGAHFRCPISGTANTNYNRRSPKLGTENGTKIGHRELAPTCRNSNRWVTCLRGRLGAQFKPGARANPRQNAGLKLIPDLILEFGPTLSRTSESSPNANPNMNLNPRELKI